jgi:chromosome segregation ATPase
MDRRLTDENNGSIFSNAAHGATVLCLAVALVTVSGCEGCRTVTSTVGGQIAQIEKMLKDNTVLERAHNEVAKAKESRRNLQTTAQDFRVNVGVAVREIERFEEEIADSRNAFTSVQDAAKAAGLPRRADATPEDMTKQIQIGTRTLTGSEVYSSLQQYKNEIGRAESRITLVRRRLTHYTNEAAKIETQLPGIDANIDQMEHQLDELKMYRELLQASRTLKGILPENRLDSLLNSDSMFAEMQKQIDILATTLNAGGDTRLPQEIKDEINTGKKPSITDDDLI